jgi:hypothetical protein
VDHEGLRLTEILTTSAAVANYQGHPQVGPGHVLHAVAILRGELRIEDLGRPVSPLVPRGPGAGAAEPAVRDLAMRWFAILGNDVSAVMTAEQLEAFVSEVRALIPPGAP